MKKITFETLVGTGLYKYTDINSEIEMMNSIARIFEENNSPMTCTEILEKGHDIPLYNIQQVSAILYKMVLANIVQREEVEIENPFSFTSESDKHCLYYEDGKFAGIFRTAKWEDITITVNTKAVYSLI